ncbi:MAG TPA: hypothetical protein VEN81_06065 [Planctomycetota bacterium]|nr:hypothetical protein [Planctomycetota bacterium]
MNPLTLEEVLAQLREMRRMGPVRELLKMLPPPMGELAGDIDEKDLDDAETILSAMTPEERQDSDLLIDESRRRDVARRAGRPIEKVNSLIAQYYAARRFASDHDGGSN